MILLHLPHGALLRQKRPHGAARDILPAICESSQVLPQHGVKRLVRDQETDGGGSVQRPLQMSMGRAWSWRVGQVGRSRRGGEGLHG